jgi:hypothetical protein
VRLIVLELRRSGLGGGFCALGEAAKRCCSVIRRGELMLGDGGRGVLEAIESEGRWWAMLFVDSLREDEPRGSFGGFCMVARK